MKRWWHTPVFHATAFLSNAFFLVLSLGLFLRFTQEPAEPGDDYYTIVELLPAILSIVPATLAMWLLRRLARRLAWTRWWQWTLLGAAIGLAWLRGLGWLGLAVERAHFSVDWQWAKNTLMFVLLSGPLAYHFLDWWLPLPALAATASVLFLVQRTFGWGGASNRSEEERPQ